MDWTWLYPYMILHNQPNEKANIDLYQESWLTSMPGARLEDVVASRWSLSSWFWLPSGPWMSSTTSLYLTSLV